MTELDGENQESYNINTSKLLDQISMSEKNSYFLHFILFSMILNKLKRAFRNTFPPVRV